MSAEDKNLAYALVDVVSGEPSHEAQEEDEQSCALKEPDDASTGVMRDTAGVNVQRSLEVDVSTEHVSGDNTWYDQMPCADPFGLFKGRHFTDHLDEVKARRQLVMASEELAFLFLFFKIIYHLPRGAKRPKLLLSGRAGPCPGWTYHVEIRGATAR